MQTHHLLAAKSVLVSLGGGGGGGLLLIQVVVSFTSRHVDLSPAFCAEHIRKNSLFLSAVGPPTATCQRCAVLLLRSTARCRESTVTNKTMDYRRKADRWRSSARVSICPNHGADLWYETNRTVRAVDLPKRLEYK